MTKTQNVTTQIVANLISDKKSNFDNYNCDILNCKHSNCDKTKKFEKQIKVQTSNGCKYFGKNNLTPQQFEEIY